MANSKDKQKTVAKHLYMKGTPVAQIVELTGAASRSAAGSTRKAGKKNGPHAR